MKKRRFAAVCVTREDGEILSPECGGSFAIAVHLGLEPRIVRPLRDEITSTG